MKKLFGFAIALSGALCLLTGQDATINVSKEGGIPAIAIPDLRGAGDAQKFMAAFNETLSADVKASGRFKIVPKTSLPTFVPQQPSDFQQPAPPPAAPPSADASSRRMTVVPPNGGGRWMQDWSSPPAQANYLAFGYTAAQNGVLVLQGWLYDLSQRYPRQRPAYRQALSRRQWMKPARARSPTNSPPTLLLCSAANPYSVRHIYFTSDRTGHKEIWMMDPDGKNQRQITRFQQHLHLSNGIPRRN